jgi:Mn2+/Fe2+ NRAMP family transporter
MEKQSSDSRPAGVAREQLRAARQAYDSSVRRAMAPAGLILALSVFCGVLTVPSKYKGPGDVASIIAVVWLLAALLNTSARHRWRSLRSLPKPKWGVAEVTLLCVAVLVGGVIGPHLLAGHSNSALASWSLGGAVAVVVAACMFAAYASYRRRGARTWQR